MLGEFRVVGIEQAGSRPARIGGMIALIALLTGLAGMATADEPAPAPEESAATPADRVTLGVDLVSRYVWRGQIYGDAPCIQPWAGVTVAGFTLGTWGSFSFSPMHGDSTDGSNTTEVDLSLSRSQDLPFGTITATLTDYHYPSVGNSYLEFADDSTGGHIVDIGVAYRGPDGLPLGLCGSVNIYNDDDHAAYVEASWPLVAGSTQVSVAAGAALGSSLLYSVEESGVHFVHTAVTASRSLEISKSFAPTLKVAWVLNPYKEQASLVATLSI